MVDGRGTSLRRQSAALAHRIHEAIDDVPLGKERLGTISILLFLIAAWALASGSATGVRGIGAAVTTLLVCGGLVVVLAGGKSKRWNWWPPGRNPRGRR